MLWDFHPHPIPGSMPAPPAQPPALTVTGVSKTYRMWATPASRLWVPLLYRMSTALRMFGPLSAWLQQRAEARMHQHQALSDVGFSLARGEALGIIGHNGSGKSTLLQIVAGVLPATTGTVEVNGRVAALLELGSGFNGELTGRENVRVNAAILGLSPTQIRARMDDIVAFADIGDYIDEPVKTYSSGMALRLAFAVQVHTDPDILIVDEALAVGDAAFQAKAMARIDQILARGTTLLFVGHDLAAVKTFCHRAMLLDGGRLVREGEPDDVITEYLDRVHQKSLASQVAPDGAALRMISGGFGSDEAQVVAARLVGMGKHGSVRFEQRIEAELRVRMPSKVKAPTLLLDVLDAKSMRLSGRRIALRQEDAVACGDALEYTLRLGFPARFQQGVYRLGFRLADARTLETTRILARQQNLLSFDVVDDSRALFTGLFPLPIDVEAVPPDGLSEWA